MDFYLLRLIIYEQWLSQGQKKKIELSRRPVHNSEIFLMKEIGIDKKYFSAVKYPLL